MFFDEEMLLDLRLNILDKFVDQFVNVESSYTHSGKEKKLIFDINKYPKFKEKIDYIIVRDLPHGIEQIGKDDSNLEITNKEIMNALRRENFQRNTIKQGLINANDNDWIIISDLDEIPDLSNINFNSINKKIIFFKQKVFYYKLNLELKTLRWIGSKACKKKYLKSPQWLRNVKDKIYPKWRIDILFAEKKYNDIFLLFDFPNLQPTYFCDAACLLFDLSYCCIFENRRDAGIDAKCTSMEQGTSSLQKRRNRELLVLICS